MVGGAAGVGRAVSLLLARKGAKVAVVDRVEEAASALAAEIRARGGEAESWRMDQDAAGADEVFSQVREAFGAIDVVVQTAVVPEPPGTRAKAVRYLSQGGRIINLAPMLGEGKGKAVYGRVSRRRAAGK